MKKNLIPLFVALLALQFSMGALTKPALADEYPSQDIRWIIGGKAGGGVDLYARTVGRHMEKYLPKGVHVIVENRPGAGHSIANNMVYNAKPDGYTIGMPFMPGLYLMQILQKTEFDMTKINWVGMIDHDAQCISISSKSKYKTLDDLKKADVVRVGIVGPASEAGVLLACKSLGIKAEYVAGHKNSKEAALAAIRGDVDIVGFTYNSTRKFIAKKQITIRAMLTSRLVQAVRDQGLRLNTLAAPFIDPGDSQNTRDENPIDDSDHNGQGRRLTKF